MSRPLGTVAMAMAAAACGEATAPADPLPPIEVLTYNVQGLPDPITAGRYGMPLTARMARISEELDRFSLVGLQESFDDDAHAALISAASHPVQRWFTERAAPDRVYGAGLAQLAGLGDVWAEHDQLYSQCHGLLDGASDCLASKGVQGVTLDLGGGARLTWLNTHHEAGGGAEDEAARSQQVTEVLALIDALPTEDAVVFTGDFNMRRSDPADAVELARYEAAGLRDACLELACAEPDRIDLVWVRDGGSLQLTPTAWEVAPGLLDVDGRPLADHDPIHVTVAAERVTPR